MKDVFAMAQNRILAKRVKGKFTPKAEEVRNVRVLSSGVASVAGQVYNAETGGYRAGDVVEAVNVGTKGNAHYQAKLSGGGLTETEVKRMIEKALEGFSQNEIKQVTSTIPPVSEVEPTINDIIKSMTVVSGTGDTMTITIPSYAAIGDEFYGFAGWEGSITGVDTDDRSDADTHIDGVTSLYIIDANSDNNWDNPPPRGGTNLMLIEHTVDTGEAGTDITWHLVYIDPDTSATTPYSGAWTIVMFLLDGTYRRATEDTGYDVPGYEFSYYDEPPSGAVYNRAAMEIDIALPYRLCFFAASSVGSSTFTPNILMTKVYEESNFVIWARIVKGPYSFENLHFNPTATYFVGAVYPVPYF